MNNKIPKVLTIAGSDSGAGAGIQADLKTFASLGVYGISAITSVTSQNTKKVSAVYDLPPSVVRSQIEAVLSDIGADAVKIGMLSDSSIIKTISAALKKYKVRNIVLDTVMVSGTGTRLLKKSAIATLKKELMPLALIVTPNIQEAETLSGLKIDTEEDMKKAARKIKMLGCKNILIKGSHLNKSIVTDIFYNGKQFTAIKNKRIPKKSHGTGCTLSSAIAAYLAKGCNIKESVKKATIYTQTAIKNSYKINSNSYALKH